MNIESYNLMKPELEDLFDTVKTVIIGSLVTENKMSDEEAEEWCRTHTIILRKKNFFRTISMKWSKEKTSENDMIIIVKKVI